MERLDGGSRTIMVPDLRANRSLVLFEGDKLAAVTDVHVGHRLRDRLQKRLERVL